jgi:hypothetical protein
MVQMKRKRKRGWFRCRVRENGSDEEEERMVQMMRKRGWFR